jgi:hypothetical protein
MEWPAPPSGVVGSPANQEEEETKAVLCRILSAPPGWLVAITTGDARADFVVELRGFEPLTSSVPAHPRALRRPPLPRSTLPSAPLDPALKG